MKNKTTIIAEIGINHNGDMILAKQLITKAKQCKADVVKFQMFKTDNLSTLNAPLAKYQRKNTKNKNQYNMLKKYELNNSQILNLKNYCKKINIKFIASVFDTDSLEFLKKLNTPIIKIPSGEINNLPLLEEIGKLKKNIIMSSGMSTMSEIGNAINILNKNGTNKNKITILHCTTNYPTNFNEVNLKAMLNIKKNLNINVGYSDHTEGIEVSIAAVSLGAKIIERHFTLNKNSKGPDHRSSLEPKEFKKMVESIRNIELSLGNGIKKPSTNEKLNIFSVRKSIVAKKNINKGEVFTLKNITIKRPGNGKSPMLWYKIIGTKSKKNYKANDLI